LTFWLLGALFPTLAPAQQPLSEYQVKAAYLYNFANFAGWPAQSFGTGDSPFRVCLVGGDPFGPVLDNTLRDEKVGPHRIDVVRDPPHDALARCHLLFLSAGVSDVGRILRGLQGAPVLTISDARGFVRQGGIVEFVADAGRIRFDINLSAARASGITLSSRLLQVARQLHE
jgi:hypothetical protein